MKEHRLLITGSRDWTDEAAIRDALADYWRSVQPAVVVLVSGDCRTGADAIAQRLWSERNLPLETHPADWATHRNAAGPKRNAHMVSLGADFCLAFIGPCTSSRCRRNDVHDSHGATGCLTLATNAGIPSRIIRAVVPTDDAARPHSPAYTQGLTTQNGTTAP